MHCPLCENSNIADYHQDKKRVYLQCSTCSLVFVPASYHLDQALEKAEYDKHENDVNDQGYITFLSRIINPMLERISVGAHGLDLGCGPAPALAKQFERRGHKMSLYDLYYFNDELALTQQYDFVTCTEVIEHIAKPKAFIEQLLRLLKSNAPLGLMTKLVINPERFNNWHYKNDPTHICFYSRETFAFIAERYGLKVEFIGQDVIIINKNT